MARFASLSSVKLAAKTKLSSIPYQSDYAEYITGQVFSDQAGTLWVEESFDLPVFPGKLVNAQGIIATGNNEAKARWETITGATPTGPTVKEIKENREEREKQRSEQENKFLEEWAAEGHWSIATYPEGKSGETAAKFAVTAKGTVGFATYSGAPFWRITFESEAAEVKELRAFARAFERGKV